jgi:hypothetical protein
MDPITTSVAINIASSLLYDLGKNSLGGKSTTLENAILSVVVDFPNVEGLAHTLRRWLGDQTVSETLVAFASGSILPNDDLIAKLSQIMIGKADFYLPGQSEEMSAHIVTNFLETLKNLYLQSPSALSFLENRIHAYSELQLAAFGAYLPASTSSDGLHSEIDDAKGLINAHKYEAAKELLERLKAKKGGSLSAEHRFRVLTNLAACHLGLGMTTDAARLYLESASYGSDLQKRHENETFGRFLLHEFEATYDLATKYRPKWPLSTRLAMLAVSSSPDTNTVERLRADLDSALLNDAELLTALCLRAIREYKYELARTYGQKAIEAKTDWASPHFYLGLSLQALGLEAWRNTNRAAGADLIKEAIKEFTAAADCAEQERTSLIRAHALLHRSNAKRLLDDESSAFDDIDLAQTVAPEDVEVKAAFAEVLFLRGERVKALTLLRSISVPDRPNFQLRLADLLLKSGSTEELREAVQLFQDVTYNNTQVDPATRAHVYGRAIEALITLKDLEWINKFISHAEKTGISLLDLRIMRAMYYIAADDQASAGASVRSASELLTEHSPSDELRKVGTLASNLSLFQIALDSWLPLSSRTELDFATRRALEAAAKLDRDDIVLIIASSLRKSGVVDQLLVLLEADRLVHYDYEEAALVLKNYCSSRPDDKEVRLRLSLLGLLRSRQEWIDARPEVMPSLKAASPWQGRLAAQIMKLGGFPNEALLYGYELLRLHFGNVEAHRAFMFNLFPMGQYEPNIRRDIPAAALNTAVKYLDEHGAQRWVVLEEREEVLTSLNEVAPSHEISRNLLGKTVGDSFVVATGQIRDRVGTVLEIQDKFVYRYQDCLSEWQFRFPEHKDFEQFTIQKRGSEQVDF